MMKQYRNTNYSVDTNGNVYGKKGNLLKPYKRKDGYTELKLSQNGKILHRKLTHRIIAETFIPNPENKPEVNHINGDKTDNRVENLEWVNRSENIKHRSKLGITNKIISDDIIEHILNEKNMSQREMAKKYNVSQSFISLLKNKKHRKYVKSTTW